MQNKVLLNLVIECMGFNRMHERIKKTTTTKCWQSRVLPKEPKDPLVPSWAGGAPWCKHLLTLSLSQPVEVRGEVLAFLRPVL